MLSLEEKAELHASITRARAGRVILTPEQSALLREVMRQKGSIQTVLASATGVSQSAISMYLTSVSSRGLPSAFASALYRVLGEDERLEFLTGTAKGLSTGLAEIPPEEKASIRAHSRAHYDMIELTLYQGQVVGRIIRDMHLTQKEVAGALGISQTSLSNYLTGSVIRMPRSCASALYRVLGEDERLEFLAWRSSGSTLEQRAQLCYSQIDYILRCSDAATSGRVLSDLLALVSNYSGTRGGNAGRG